MDDYGLKHSIYLDKKNRKTELQTPANHDGESIRKSLMESVKNKYLTLIPATKLDR